MLISLLVRKGHMAGSVIVASKLNSARKQPPECVSASPDEQLTLESWSFFFLKKKKKKPVACHEIQSLLTTQFHMVQDLDGEPYVGSGGA